MTQKTISLPESTYNELKKVKREGETYSDTIIRLIEKEKKAKKGDISKYFGQLEEGEDGEWDRILNTIYEDRNRPSTREPYLLEE